MKKMRQIETESRPVTPAAPMASKTTPKLILFLGSLLNGETWVSSDLDEHIWIPLEASSLRGGPDAKSVSHHRISAFSKVSDKACSSPEPSCPGHIPVHENPSLPGPTFLPTWNLYIKHTNPRRAVLLRAMGGCRELVMYYC